MVTTGVNTAERRETLVGRGIGAFDKLRVPGLFTRPTGWALLALVLLSVLQRPGRTTFDTKLDLAVDPGAFLVRALHLWNPQATGGELQNQAYGYLFPMGPYFALTHLLGVPTWLAQRLWAALLLCLAFGGALLLARALRIGTEHSRLVAALGYALAPRMLTEIGPLSAEMLPAAMLPWVMLPLVRAARIGSPRRAALLSALAVFGMGGVNGAMVVMSLVLPVLWLLTREWTRSHVRLVLWWGAGVLAATLWWILPLLLLGEYSLPFLDYIESATNTTAPMSLFEVLRGTNQWVAYVFSGTPWWPSGWLLIDNPVLMLATGGVAAVGMAGLARAGLRHRRFLVVGVVTGLTLLTIGYVGTLDSPLAGQVRHLLDGPLAPLRNVHKFEPVLRLPLMLAFAHGISVLGTRGTWQRRAKVATGWLLVLVVAAPAWLGTLRPGQGWDEVPGYWQDATAWLARTDANGRALLLPSTGFGEYTWGRTVDEPAQALARSPWAVRNQIPLGSEGNTRLMDAVDDALADGRGAPGLADLLTRSGYRFLVLRNDIDRTDTHAPPVSVLRAGLDASPGIALAASFGPVAQVPVTSPVDAGVRLPALQVYQVRAPAPLASATAVADTATVSGGPESLLPLLDTGALRGDQPAVLAGDGGAPGGPVFGTDGLRRRERNVGDVRDNLSQTMTATEAPRQQRPSLDVLPFAGAQHQTVAAYRGIRAVTASTSGSFADASGGSDPSLLPFAAVDGDPATAWHSSSFTGPAGQWLQVDLDTPRVVDDVQLSLVDDLRVGWRPTRLRITTSTGSVDHDVPATGGPQRFATAPGLTGSVRVTVLAVAGNRDDGNVGISELAIPDTRPQRALQVPADLPSGTLATFAFTRGAQPRYACVPDPAGPRCDPNLARQGEEPDGVHRLFGTSAPATYDVTGTVLPAPGGSNPVAAPGLLVTGSSQLGGDPAVGATAAVDGDPATAWIADVGDPHPAVNLLWNQQRAVDSVQLVASRAATMPTEVEVITPGYDQVLTPDRSGRISFPVQRTDRLRLVVADVAIADPTRDTLAPPGVAEVRVPGVADLMRPLPPSTPFSVPCGQGPTVTVDGADFRTSVQGTLGDLQAHRAVRLTACRDLAQGVDLAAGQHEVRTARSPAFVVQDLTATPRAAALPPVVHRGTVVEKWQSTHRLVRVGPGGPALLTVPENANDGWVATVDGQPLARTRVDGWQQAWLLPAGQSTLVALDFVPDTAYRTRLLVGALAVLALLVAVAVPVRRRGYAAAEAGMRWVPLALVLLTGLLGGMLAVVLLIGCLLSRQLWPQSTRVLAFGGTALATVVAVAGRLLGLGQDWAYGAVAQAALLLAAAAVVAGTIDWFVDVARSQPKGKHGTQRS